MATYTKTFHQSEGAANFGYGKYNISTWWTNSNYPAYQGDYNSTSDGSRVGFCFLDNVGTTLTGKSISNIALSITYTNAGKSDDAVLTICKSLVTAAPKTGDGIKGSNVVGDTLGTLTAPYNTTSSYTLNSSSNTALFNAMAAYLAAGNNMLVFYNGETKSGTYTSNYRGISDLTITVTYTDPGYAYYKNNGTWVKCKVYYKNNGTWVQVKPYYKNNGTWTLV